MLRSLVRTVIVVSFVVLLSAVVAYPEREPIDRIVAVAGSKVILASELANQMQMVALQTGKRPTTEAEVQELKTEILEQMISDQLFLLAAEQDTTISIQPAEIDQALDDHIAQVSSNFNSQEEFTQALASEGLTIRDLKKRYRSDIEGQLLKQRFIGRKLQTVSVSRKEVEEFYKKFSDSIPAQPEAVKLAHILLEIGPSDEVEDSVKAKATELRRQAIEGADFATLSVQNSSLGAGVGGGDLGYVAKGDVVPEFARAAFKLSIGSISGVVRTQFGYHVIKCEGRRGDRLKLRHILLAVAPTFEDSVRTRQLADSLIAVAKAGADFRALAKKFSTDNTTRAEGGELGWFATNKMPSEFISSVTGWTEVGDIKGPILSKFGLHILKLLDYQQERKYSLESDFDKIKELTRQDKTGRLIDEWVEDFKSKTYIEIRE